MIPVSFVLLYFYSSSDQIERECERRKVQDFANEDEIAFRKEQMNNNARGTTSHVQSHFVPVSGSVKMIGAIHFVQHITFKVPVKNHLNLIPVRAFINLTTLLQNLA